MAVFSGAGAFAGTAPRVAIFPFEMIDASRSSEYHGFPARARPEEQARLGMMTALLQEAVAADGRYAVADLAAFQKEIAAAAPLHGCNGCEADLARKAGAGFAVLGIVQKVSEGLLTVNVYLRDTHSGAVTQAMTAAIQGNTDGAWRRGLLWLIKNRLLPAAPAQAAPQAVPEVAPQTAPQTAP